MHPQVPLIVRDVLYLTAVFNRSKLCKFIELQASSPHTNGDKSIVQLCNFAKCNSSDAAKKLLSNEPTFPVASTRSSMEFTTSRREISGLAGIQQSGEFFFHYSTFLSCDLPDSNVLCEDVAFQFSILSLSF